MVAVAQLVRAPLCESGGRGFKSPQPPNIPRYTIFYSNSNPTCYNLVMKSRLQTKYDKYRKTKSSKKARVSFLRSFLPEMIFRTTKLEGESITRQAVNAIFK